MRLLSILLLLLATLPLQANGEVWEQRLIAEPVFGDTAAVYKAGNPANPAIVLVHGIGDNGVHDWDLLAAELAADYYLLGFDLPGFADSTRANRAYTPDRYVRLLDFLIRRELPGRDFILIGHSLGGAISLRFAAEHPENLRRLIIVDAAGILHRTAYSAYLGRLGVPDIFSDQVDGFAERLIGGILGRMEKYQFGDPNWILGTEWTREKFLRGSPRAIAGYALVMTDFSETLRKITVPTRVIWGADDPVAPLRTGQLLASVLPQAALDVIDDAGHVPMRERPDVFNELVRVAVSLPDFDFSQQIQARGYRQPRQPIETERSLRCEDERNRVITGQYLKVELINCNDAIIDAANIGELTVRHSRVSIINSHIGASQPISEIALHSHFSRIEMTGGSIWGETAVAVSGGVLDFAGVSIISTQRGIEAVTADALLQFSVSEVDTPSHSGYQHQVVELIAGEQF